MQYSNHDGDDSFERDSIDTKGFNDGVRVFQVLFVVSQVKDLYQILKFRIRDFMEFTIILAIFVECLHHILAHLLCMLQ